MRFSSATVLAALCSVALAQNLLDKLPKCARDCFGNDFGNCSPLDFGCICGNSTRIASLSCCVSTGCDDKDEETVINFAKGLCEAEGHTVPTQASCAPGPSNTGSASSGASSGAPSTAASGAATTGAQTTGSVGGAEQTETGEAGPESTGAAPAPSAVAGIQVGLALVAGGLLAAL